MNQSVIFDLLTNRDYYIFTKKPDFFLTPDISETALYFGCANLTMEELHQLLYSRMEYQRFLNEFNIIPGRIIDPKDSFSIFLRCTMHCRHHMSYEYKFQLNINLSDKGCVVYFHDQLFNFSEILEYLVNKNSWKLNLEAFKPEVLETLSLLSQFRLFGRA